ncbi:AMP-binding protein [Thalassococcus sp. BH17M4-6]|uniref:AMP-binding protein n=1 Tax=Thalassococcus sp. BH17M4-6 TaxID=3413148 RepID=UPI003BE2B9C2
MTATPSPLSQRLWSRITDAADAPFWIGRDARRSYAVLASQVRRITGCLQTQNVQPGDRVMILARDDWTGFSTWLGCLLNGAVPILPATDAGIDRLRGIAARAEPVLIVASPDRPGLPYGTTAQVLPDADIDTPGAQADPSLILPESNLAYVLFTSGSTGAPKGVMITHAHLNAQLQTVARVFQVTPKARIFNGLVLSHTDGLIQGPMLAAFAGARLIRPPAFAVNRLNADLDWLAEEGATHMVAAPALLDLIDRFATREDCFARPGAVGILSSAATLRPALWDRIEARFGVPVLNEYGMTETVAVTHFAGSLPEAGARHSIGRPVDCEARIAGDGPVGELQVRGATVFAGYMGDPERTRAAFDGDWLRTGDLARKTDAGDYHLLGRRDTAINVGGFLIHPEEIDEAVMAFAGITEAQTVGLDDPVHGAVPVTAFVADSPVPQAELMAHCRARLELRKMPRRVVQVTGIPRTASNKPDLPALRILLTQAEAKAPPGPDNGDLDARILAIAAQVFGVALDDLTLAGTPDTVPGWDSYAHTTLMLEVEAAFGIRIGTADILNVQSLRDLRDIVAKAVGTGAPGDIARLERIRPGKAAGTLIALPAIGGRSEYVRRFLRTLDRGPAVHAMSLESDHIDPDDPDTVPAAARRCAAVIARDDLSEPLILMGPSFGGFLAYETAAALADTGHRIGAVILFDTAIPWRYRKARRLHALAYAARRVRHSLRPQGQDDQIAFVPGFGELDLADFPEAQRDKVRRSFLAIGRYKPSRAHLPMLIFAADNRWQGRIPVEDNLGWGHFNTGPMTMIRLGEGHTSAIKDPATARAAAERINQFLGAIGAVS